MAKKLAIIQGDQGGYIVEGMQSNGPSLLVFPNFGAAVKFVRTFFDEQKGKTDGNPEQASDA